MRTDPSSSHVEPDTGQDVAAVHELQVLRRVVRRRVHNQVQGLIPQVEGERRNLVSTRLQSEGERFDVSLTVGDRRRMLKRDIVRTGVELSGVHGEPARPEAFHRSMDEPDSGRAGAQMLKRAGGPHEVELPLPEFSRNRGHIALAIYDPLREYGRVTDRALVQILRLDDVLLRCNPALRRSGGEVQVSCNNRAAAVRQDSDQRFGPHGEPEAAFTRLEHPVLLEDL